MRMLVAGCLAIGAAWLWDRFLRFLGWPQKFRVGLWLPLGEEIIKYSAAVAFALPPWLLYTCFGLGEGCLEALILKKRSKFRLILAGMLTHFGFGVFFFSNLPQGFSFGLGIITHLIWNNLLLVKVKC